VAFPAHAMPSHVVAPIVAVVSAALLGLAVFSYRIHLLRRNRARRAQQHLQELASVALEGLAVCHDGIIVAANSSLERIVGAKSGVLIGQQLSSLFPAAAIERMSPSQEYDADLLCNEGIVAPVRILWRQVNLGGLPRLVLAVRDQRERLQTEAKIRALAFTDTLTGLPNRARFNDLVGTYAAGLSISGGPFAILLIDLDQFKAVNDTLGHPAGDSLLRLVAARLRDLVDPLRDTVARLGGDEFAILSRSAVSDDCLQSLASDVVREMGRDFHIGYQSVGIGASVGVAMAPRDGNDADDLVRNADLALYDAKATGRNAFRLFDENLRAKAAERRALEADLRAAIANDEFHVVYQPLLATRSSRIECAEALVRWHHPIRGTVSPADFIPVSEETGIIIDIGRLVLRRACEDAASWPSHLRVAVNLSPVQFRDPHFVDVVDEILTETSFDPRRLEFEITEGVLVLDEERVIETLKRLKERGISLAMDDFGTGYSSLNYLRRYPFDKIKIDRSFVCNLPHDDECVAIVRAIVALAKATGMKTVVEGVETEEQSIFAQLEGCDFIQGYFIGKPSADVSKFASIFDQEAA
jgi:diguanylate cyclase